ncbi:hypothetical protein KUTeg_013575 [Tegillarca granosa]|uniref:Phosphoinositide phospholipase C n=1 Tax=Tegillarca granosa TaxID=220873 RepID=A0ABQ9EWJ4_TEGGR|nr:hypothetical protein KUTeg_013575 [Tegillarca granosa]
MAGAKPGVHCVQLRPISVPENLIKGNKFIKWDESSTIGTPVTLKVDPKGYILYWKDQNKDMDCLDISIIRDTRTGKYAKVPKASGSSKEGKLKESCIIGPSDIPVEDKTVTVVYGMEMTNISFINFVCASKEVAKEWCDEILKYATNLLAQNGSALTYLEKSYTKLTHVLDVNGRIPAKNIVKLVASHRDDRRRVEKALEAAGFVGGKNDTLDPSKFQFEDYFNFYRHLVGRTEVDKVFDEVIHFYAYAIRKDDDEKEDLGVRGAKKKPYLTVEQFVQFLNKEQRDPRLNEILYPYYTIKQAQEFIDMYETKHGMAAKGHLSQEGFLKFLMSEDNNVVPADLLDLSQDMTQPLSHYFINSSHNTYLTGHQLTSRSSVELYRQVLLSGCRCIELDCWDGKTTEEEPVITHGYTMCSEISFREVIEAIAESAFKTSDYPVILSFENHCSPKQQAKMAQHCRNIFGDMLLTECIEGYELQPDVPLPSPELLFRKIIVKNKKKHFNKDKKPPPVLKSNQSSKQFNTEDIVANVNGEPEKKRTSSQSAESTVENVINEPPVDYEVASDSDSSDFEDEDNLTEEEVSRRQGFKQDKGTAGSEAEAGLEMSALVNYIQPIHFHSFEISEKRRRSYEISSFVETQAATLLKEYPVEFVNYNKRQLSRVYPRGTRVDSSNFLPQIFWNAGCQLVALNFQTLDLAMQLNLGIFEYNNRSGYILKPDFMRRYDRRFDPFAESTVDGIVAGTVTLKVISAQCLTDKKTGTYVEVEMYGLPTDTQRKKRTKMVQSNGINPVYDEDPFVFKKVVLPNLAVIRIALYDEGGKMLGHRVLPVEGLRPGYRHLALRNECNLPLLLPSVFLYISVKDYVPDEIEMFAEALINPIAYLDKLEKHSQQLAVLEDFDMGAPSPTNSSDKLSDTLPSNSSPVRKNGSLPNIPTQDTDRPLQYKTSFNQHQKLANKESTTSTMSGSSGGLPRIRPMPSQTSENGFNQLSVVVTTKLNDPKILEPTPLAELKKLKPYFKTLSKREKELETLKKKHEKQKQNTKIYGKVRQKFLLLCVKTILRQN